MPSKILIVDDEPNIVVPLQFLMEQQGYEVSIAESGEEAVEKLNQVKPDVVLLDIMLPGMDGFEICRVIRGDALLQHAKVIMVTALSRDVDVEKGYSIGADAFITKPFSNAEVVKCVEGLLEGLS